jgi:signal peptidase I
MHDMLKVVLKTGAALLALGLVIALTALPLCGLSPNVIISGSMTPALNVGDLVLLEGLHAAMQIETGDIIAFRVKGMDIPVSHRVIEVLQTADGPAYRTKGDADKQADQWVIPHQDVLGKVVYAVPKLGYLAGGLRSRQGFIALVVLPATGLALLEVRDYLYSEKLLRPPRRRPRPAPSRSSFFTYLYTGLLAGAVLTLVMGSSVRHQTLRAFSGVNRPAVLYHARGSIQNSGPLPVLFLTRSDDPRVRVEPQAAWLNPGDVMEISVSGDSGYEWLTTAYFFPLLPAGLLQALFEWSLPAAELAAFIPALALAVICYLLFGRGSQQPGLRSQRSIQRQRAYRW